MTFTSIILNVAKAIGVPGSLLLAICTHESGLNNIVVPHDHGSPSYGLCQIKENTAKSLGFQPNTESLMNPSTNALYAAKYLRMQLYRYDGDWCRAVAAYNAGTFNPSKQNPTIPRNIKYVKRITLLLDKKNRDFLICGARKIEP